MKKSNSLLSVANTLAHQLFNNNFGNWSECLTQAYAKAKAGNLKIITFVKKTTKKVTKRVVDFSWTAYSVVKGTGRKLKEGQKIMADICKVILGIPCVITAYENLIISIK